MYASGVLIECVLFREHILVLLHLATRARQTHNTHLAHRVFKIPHPPCFQPPNKPYPRVLSVRRITHTWRIMLSPMISKHEDDEGEEEDANA